MANPNRRPFAIPLPPELADVILDFTWDIEKLWRLELSVQPVATSSLSWHLELPLWAHNGVPFAVTPNQVRMAPDAFPEQWRRTLAADLSLPIHLLRRASAHTILDGVHRLLRADLLGISEVPTRTLTIAHLDAIASD